jgi:hypothetical protein
VIIINGGSERQLPSKGRRAEAGGGVGLERGEEEEEEEGQANRIHARSARLSVSPSRWLSVSCRSKPAKGKCEASRRLARTWRECTEAKRRRSQRVGAAKVKRKQKKLAGGG